MAKKKRTPRAKNNVMMPRLKRNKNASLPGLEDHAIKALEDVAAEYAEIRDKRQELTRDEVALKSETLKLMKKHGKTIYRHGGVLIQVVAGEEDVKVKVKKPGDEDATSLDDGAPVESAGDDAVFSDATDESSAGDAAR